MAYSTTIRRRRRTRRIDRAGNPAAIGRWLLFVAGLVALMVVVGGITRLTESGLSIAYWKPVSGILPPLDAEAWQRTFAAYQATPEYRLVNRGMTLDEFKSIFWWEYVHRLLGRLIGLAYGFPLLVLWMRRRIPSGLKPRLLLIFLLGGAQGLLGWFMVKSGLVHEPQVSHYRLAAHLLLAILIFSLLLWTALDLLEPRHGSRQRRWRAMAMVLLLLVVVQIGLGALVAGLKAGYAFNTWPKMGEHWLPPELFALKPFWRNFFDNAIMVQFLHRLNAMLVAGWCLLIAVSTWRFEAPPRTIAAALALLLLIVGQIWLGIVTLVEGVPVAIAAAHQAGAVLVLALTLYFLHMNRRTAHHL
ncbi:MAG: heme A synthase [Alphaproteobacteria bacterium]|nr:MAG: heme A synthase [Alphaproteobacteria bacterium]